jgi:hypothetical protein
LLAPCGIRGKFDTHLNVPFIAFGFTTPQCFSRGDGGPSMWIEIPPSGQIKRADLVDKEHNITSMPIQSGTAEKMTSLLLKLAALLAGGGPRLQSSLAGRCRVLLRLLLQKRETRLEARLRRASQKEERNPKK